MPPAAKQEEHDFDRELKVCRKCLVTKLELLARDDELRKLPCPNTVGRLGLCWPEARQWRKN
jgi:hypothetical protein